MDTRRGRQPVKVNRTRDKLLAGQPAFGFELSMGSPFIAEALGDCGADFLQIDHQHGDWGPESTLHALMALEGTDMAECVSCML